MEKIPFTRTTEELLGRVEKNENVGSRVFYDRENLDKLIKGAQPKERPPFANLLEDELADTFSFIGCDRQDVELYTTIGSPMKNIHAFVELNIEKGLRPDRVNLAVAGKNIGLSEKNVVFNFNSAEIDPAEGYENPLFKAKIKEISIRVALKEMKRLDKEKSLKLTGRILENVGELVGILKSSNKGAEGLVVMNDIIEESRKIDSSLYAELMKSLQHIQIQNYS